MKDFLITYTYIKSSIQRFQKAKGRNILEVMSFFIRAYPYTKNN